MCEHLRLLPPPISAVAVLEVCLCSSGDRYLSTHLHTRESQITRGSSSCVHLVDPYTPAALVCRLKVLTAPDPDCKQDCKQFQAVSASSSYLPTVRKVVMSPALQLQRTVPAWLSRKAKGPDRKASKVPPLRTPRRHSPECDSSFLESKLGKPGRQHPGRQGTRRAAEAGKAGRRPTPSSCRGSSSPRFLHSLVHSLPPRHLRPSLTRPRPTGLLTQS